MNPQTASFRPGLRWSVLLAASGLVMSVAVQAADPPVTALTIGTSVRDEITSAARVNYSDGTRSKLYRFNARVGDALSFQVSGALHAQMTVFDADGLPLAQSNTGVRSSEMATLTWRADSGQTYLLAVSGADARAYGPFQLTSQRLELYAGQALSPDTAITDLLDGVVRAIPLDIATAGVYQMDLRSSEFDTTLELNGNGVSLKDDDGGDGTNSRLLALLEPGRYTLNVRGYGEHARGLYSLSVAQWSAPEGTRLQNEGALELNGAELTGMMSGENHYTLHIDARQLVTIDLKSEMIDPYLVLTGPGVSKEDDDGGDGLNARIRTILEPGTYAVMAKVAGAASRSRSGAGLFQLSASGYVVPDDAGTGAALHLNQDVNAILIEGIANRHAFSVTQRGEYVIDMRSDDVDSYLRLYRGDEQIASNDDGGERLNARIEEELEPGEYVVEASSYGNEAGNYQIVARQK